MVIEIITWLGVIVHLWLVGQGVVFGLSQILIEGIIIFAVALLAYFPSRDPHAKLSGKYYVYLPIEPIDIGYVGGLLLVSTIFLFLVQPVLALYSNLLPLLPWTITALYREFHELIWMFQYWFASTKGKFSNVIIDWTKKRKFHPALITHYRAAAVVLLILLNLLIITRL